jgi:hypothetical protein
MDRQINVGTFFFRLDDFNRLGFAQSRISQRHSYVMAKKMAVNDLQVAERAQRTKIILLSRRSVGTVRQGLNMGGKVLDSLDLVVWQQNGA